MRSNPRILYVDDDRDSCEFMGLLLEQDGGNYEVIAVSDAEKAADLIGDLSFDLYILDYRLPGLSGVDLCRLIRTNGISAPVMFFTAAANAPARVEAISAGANAYLVKPNDLHNLPPTVRMLLKGSAALGDSKLQPLAA
jgi:two-component system, OmpR family, manganese sensing response regulator